MRNERIHELPINVRILYSKTYAKHGKTIFLSKKAEKMAYDVVEKKYGTEMVEKLKDFHHQKIGE